jgi:hypothetical protein
MKKDGRAASRQGKVMEICTTELPAAGLWAHCLGDMRPPADNRVCTLVPAVGRKTDRTQKLYPIRFLKADPLALEGSFIYDLEEVGFQI